MTLKVYNTLSRNLEEFRPVEEGKVRMYVCGLTVYDDMHVGHARTYIAFDAIIRYLRYRGYEVKYVQNVTDVDDKIIKKAGEKGVEPLKLSRQMAERAIKDQEKLGLVKADAYPKVSENMPEIIAAVKKLVESGHAYEAGGSVYFDVATFPDYGKLSHQNIEELNRHRIEPDADKKNPLDFALWKKTGEGELGFDSPWGRGRPGWHIECSVMSQKYLGERIDVHGGALDLIFPHHENEIAQSESLSGEKPFVKYWLHTGFLYSSGEKMSKSLGNITPVRDFLKEHGPEALRLFVLTTHYKSPVDYGVENIENAGKALKRLETFRRDLEAGVSLAPPEGGLRAQEASIKLEKDFRGFMDDDFKTPDALAALFKAVKKINTILTGGNDSKDSLKNALKLFDELTTVLGFNFKGAGKNLSGEEEELIARRNMLRREKKWAEADKIRDELARRGIGLRDRSDGTTVIDMEGE